MATTKTHTVFGWTDDRINRQAGRQVGSQTQHHVIVRLEDGKEDKDIAVHNLLDNSAQG